MSVRIDSAAAAQTATWAAYDNSRARPAAPAAPESTTAASAPEAKSTAPAPERATDLTRQLEERLNTQIARIRQRVDTGDSTASPSGSLGRRLDIRA